MCEAAVPQSVTIPAVPEQVRVARVFVAGVIGKSRRHADVALLLASELVADSVRHSGSAVPGGFVTVAVAAGEAGIRVEVTDAAATAPRSCCPLVARTGTQRAAGGCGWWTRSPHDGAISGAAGWRRRGSSLQRTEPCRLDQARKPRSEATEPDPHCTGLLWRHLPPEHAAT